MSEFDPKKAQLLHPELAGKASSAPIKGDTSRAESLLPIILIIIAFAAGVYVVFIPQFQSTLSALQTRATALTVMYAAAALAFVIYVHNHLQKIIEQNKIIIENQKELANRIAEVKKDA